MSISPISAPHPFNTEAAANHNKTTGTESFERVMTEEMTLLNGEDTPALLLSADPSLSTLNADLSEMDHDRHIDAFFQQALAQAPETERKIWARMKEELGIR